MTNQTKFNLSKKDIAKNLSKKTGLSVKFIEGYIDQLFDEILVVLASKKKINIKNFGSFSVKFKKSRVGRNPKKKEKEFIISARNVIKFQVSENLKMLMNNNIK